MPQTEQLSESAHSLQNQEEEVKKKSPSRSLWFLTSILFIVALSVFSYWYFYLRFHESTDDAYANGNYINVNSVISGAVIAYYADDTNLVNEGQLLVELDTTNYQAVYDRELASLAVVALQVRELYENVRASRANVQHVETDLQKTKFDYDNRLSLRHSNPEAVAKEDFVHAEQDYLSAQFRLDQAKFQLESAIAAAGNTPAEKHPRIMQQKEVIRTAYYNLKHCSIYAPHKGYIAQRSVEVGQWVTPTTNLMAVIPTNYVWVDANFKETQLQYMRIGQPATIWFDLYGSDVKYEGKVIGIASGTGSTFSLIPPQNATGNWIKIVQRLPVRISLDKATTEKFPMRLGISAQVNVDITEQDLPMLSVTAATKPIAQTRVFDLHMEDLNKRMDQIVNENLKAKPLLT